MFNNDKWFRRQLFFCFADLTNKMVVQVLNNTLKMDCFNQFVSREESYHAGSKFFNICMTRASPLTDLVPACPYFPREITKNYQQCNESVQTCCINFNYSLFCFYKQHVIIVTKTDIKPSQLSILDFYLLLFLLVSASEITFQLNCFSLGNCIQVISGDECTCVYTQMLQPQILLIQFS